MTLRAFTWWYRAHRWTSLICTVFVLVSCLTGLPLILDDEIQGKRRRRRPRFR